MDKVETGFIYNPENLDELEKKLEPELRNFELQRYQRSLDDIKGLFGQLEQKFGIGKFEFFPKYSAKTSGGIDIVISPAFIEVDSAMVLLVVAHDSGRNIFGHRREVIALEQDHMEAQGYIAVKERGKGLVIPIEAAFSDIYQSQASVRKIPGIWVEENLNKEQAERFEKAAALKSGQQESLFLKLLAHRAWKEQERFQAVYGPNGLLGFDKDYKKAFYPQHDTPSVHSEVRINRRGNIFEFERSSDKDQDGKSEIYLTERRRELKEMLGKKQ